MKPLRTIVATYSTHVGKHHLDISARWADEFKVMKTDEVIQRVMFIVAAAIAISGFAVQEPTVATAPESVISDKALFRVSGE